MKTYEIVLKGQTALLMHSDNVEWSDFMDEWRSDPENKKTSKAGDDRSPAFRWLGCCYHDGERLTIPAENVARCMMEAAGLVPVPGGKSGKTFRAQSQSGMMSESPNWEFFVGGKPVPWSALEALKDEPKFANHKKIAASLGFSLHVKRAKIAMSKHVRVRPMFPDWSARGRIAVWDEMLTREVLEKILDIAGRYKGLCDWRPGGRTPGSYGMFTAQIS
jgi:hypothetical protein